MRKGMVELTDRYHKYIDSWYDEDKHKFRQILITDYELSSDAIVIFMRIYEHSRPLILFGSVFNNSNNTNFIIKENRLKYAKELMKYKFIEKIIKIKDYYAVDSYNEYAKVTIYL